MPVALPDPAALAAGVASRARQAFTPEIQVSTDVERFEGKPLVLARVHELSAVGKPCVVKRTGRAYMRFADGDYPLSRLEMDAFIANRSRPRFDEAPVDEATQRDLDGEQLTNYLATARANDARLARLNDDELLVRTGVVTREGVPTVAGLLALGVYPQQHLPHCNLRAAVLPERAAPTVRAIDSATFTGPIATMMEDAMAWVRRNSRTRLVTDSGTGAVRDALDPPPVAVRELVGNALVHRDLADWASSRAVELRLSGDGFRITNPGGLYGITTDRLGVHPLTSARNRRLIEICKHLRTSDGNVVEALASGIPAILAALQQAGLPRPDFFDQGIAFTVIVRRDTTATTTTAAHARISIPGRELLDALDHPMTLAELAAAVHITENAARKRLAPLRASGLVTISGGRGRQTTYTRVDPHH